MNNNTRQHAVMDPVVVDDSLHMDELVNQLRRLRGENKEALLKTVQTELRRMSSTNGSPAVSPLSQTSSYSFSPEAVSPMHENVVPWPALNEQDDAFSYYRGPEVPRRPSSRSGGAGSGAPHSARRASVTSRRHRRSSSAASAVSVMGNSPFPAPLKPLPAIPPTARSSQSQRMSSQPSTSDQSSLELNRYSHSSGTTSSHEHRSSYSSSARLRDSMPPPRPAVERQPDLRQRPKPTTLEVVYWKQLVPDKKSKKNATTYFLDMSTPAGVVATKHGNNLVRFWNVSDGSVQASIKFSSYTEAHCRSREYLIRSHTILSEAAKLAVIATRFGRSLEIWNWDSKKKLQMIDDADRWVAGRFESFDAGWSPLAAYKGESNIIDLYAATRAKKPFAKVRTIDLRKAGLPLVPQYPELALSPTSPLLVAAAGPRTPRAGRPPPDRETILVAWEIHDYRDVSNTPYRVCTPWEYKKLETALPCALTTYGNLVVSLWIPASFRTVVTATAGGGPEYKLAAVEVPFRYVLVWDLADGSTNLYPIPNVTSCVSPDCRFVAYCKYTEGTSKLAILDAASGDELWAWPTPGAKGRQTDLFGDLARVTEMAFSADGKFLVVGDVDGNSGVYDVRDLL